MDDRSTHRIGPEPVRLPVGLAISLVFDEHDVLANRRGQLSDWQRQRLVRAVRLERHRFPLMLGVLGALTAATVGVALAATGVDPAVVAALAAALVVPATATIWMARRRRRSMVQMQQPSVISAVGVPSVSRSISPGYWHVRVGDTRFELDGGTVAVLDTNRALRVYTAALGPGSPALLSAEFAD